MRRRRTVDCYVSFNNASLKMLAQRALFRANMTGTIVEYVLTRLMHRDMINIRFSYIGRIVMTAVYIMGVLISSDRCGAS
jgi:hypothetical protein